MYTFQTKLLSIQLPIRTRALTPFRGTRDNNLKTKTRESWEAQSLHMSKV